jgi:hypothetical protein
MEKERPLHVRERKGSLPAVSSLLDLADAYSILDDNIRTLD